MNARGYSLERGKQLISFLAYVIIHLLYLQYIDGEGNSLILEEYIAW